MKRFLSIILATAMVLALVPSAFAAEKNVAVYENSVQFLLMPQAYGETYISGNLNNLGYDRIVMGGKWRYVRGGINGINLYNKALQFNQYIQNDATTGKKKYDVFWLDINLKPEKTGTFVPSLTFETGSNAPIFDVYFYESTASASDTNRIGTVDLYSATAGKETVSFNEVAISADKEYTLRLRAVGVNPAIDVSADRVLLQARVTGFSLTADTSAQAIENGTLTYLMGLQALNADKMWNTNNSISTITNDVNSSYEGLRYKTELRYFPYVDWEFETNVIGTGEDNKTKGTSETPYKTMNLAITDPYRVDNLTSQMTAVDIYSYYVMYGAFFQSRFYWDKVNSATTKVPSLVLRINVPYAGKYNLKLSGTKHVNGIISDVYFGKAESDTETAKTRLDRTAIASTLDKVGVYHVNKASKADASISFANTTVESAVVNVPAAGEYWVAFLCNVAETETHTDADSSKTRFFNLNKVELEPIEKDCIKTFDITFGKNRIEAGKGTFVNAKAVSSLSGERTVEAAAIVYTSSDLSVATVDANGNITGVAPGTAMILAKMKGSGNVATARITVTEPAPAEDADITDAFKTEEPVATQYAPSVSGAGYIMGESSETVEGITETAQADGSYKMYAPETSGDYKFLYWAKGLSLNKRIVSYENEFNYIPAGGDNNILIAVYDKSGSTANKTEFYNANGQLIKAVTDESVDKTIPVLPSMAGYNKAISWKEYNGNVVYTSENEGEEAELSGTKIFVAQYEQETPSLVTVTVTDGNGTATVAYGEKVTCTADSSKGKLKWWKKTVGNTSEIVSVEETYSFLAWEDCTVTAEYAETKPAYTGNTMKIVLDTFRAGDAVAVMAEFIGFGTNAVEKGIIYNGIKIAMTRPGDQFTVTGVANDTFKGYAIVKNGDGFNLIVDGEVTISE